jgi:hypothetical protein
MNQQFALLALTILFSTASGAAELKPFTGQDLSGIYTCTGDDAHDGAFKAKVTLSIDKKHSYERYGSYSYRMDVDGFGTYWGVLAASGDTAAITFANEDVSKKDYGTGIAKIEKTKDGKIKFEKFYYQPEYQGSNHGMENCVRN